MNARFGFQEQIAGQGEALLSLGKSAVTDAVESQLDPIGKLLRDAQAMYYLATNLPTVLGEAYEGIIEDTKTGRGQGWLTANLLITLGGTAAARAQVPKALRFLTQINRRTPDGPDAPETLQPPPRTPPRTPNGSESRKPSGTTSDPTEGATATPPPRQPNAPRGRGYSQDDPSVRSFAKATGTPLDESVALVEVLNRRNISAAASHAIGEDAIADSLGVNRNSQKLPEARIWTNDGKLVLPEVKNQINGPDISHALETFADTTQLIESRFGADRVSRYDIFVPEGAKLKEGFNVNKDGILFRGDTRVTIPGSPDVPVRVLPRPLGPNQNH